MTGIADVLYEINVLSVTFRIILAMLLGGILGIERGRKHRPAGFRTYMLVCLGTTIVMLTNQYVYEMYGGGDPVRMGAQVVSGIGFLGAGTIIVTGHNQVKGLTTAAGLWTAACIGLAIGVGFYEGAIIGGLAIIVILMYFHKVDGFILGKSKQMEIYVESESLRQLNTFLRMAKQQNLEIRDVILEQTAKQEQAGLGAIVMIKWDGKIRQEEVVEHLQELPGIWLLEEI